jgi:ABC-2 type transport system ATP-binding protein
MAYTVEARAITKSFGDRSALDHVDLAIETGTVFALLGPNGAGKTTLVRILATLVRPDAGSATIAGHDLVADPLAVKGSISLTGQFAAVDDLLTGQENLEMVARLLRLPRRVAQNRVAELLAAFDLTADRLRRAGTYSGGMRRRLDLAMSMIKQPTLLFLDEPTTGLDLRSREQLWTTVRQLVDNGVTILLTTQYLEEADRLADTVAVLDHGRIVAQGSTAELKARVGSEVLRLEFADPSSYRQADRTIDAFRTDEPQRTLDVATDGTGAEVYDILSRLAAVGVSASKVIIQRPGLDEVFLSVTDGPSTPTVHAASVHAASVHAASVHVASIHPAPKGVA